MSKKYLKITTYVLLIVFVLGVFAPMVVHAQAASNTSSSGSWLGSLFSIGNITLNVIDYFAAAVSYAALWIMHWLLVITGDLLNVSITMTLHIKDFVNSTQGVYLVWQTIRDVSGMFVIFMLLYASFKVILGFDTVGGVGNLIKNIVIAGILINFSFFITSLLIDASNMVSLVLYNGIVATPTTITGSGTQTIGGQTVTCPNAGSNLNTCVISENTLSGKDGGLSGIFMAKLAPQVIYNPDNSNLSNTSQSSSNNQFLQILLQGVVGCILMFTMSMSFLLAALAFVARLIILIVLLAFSPIWFASMIFPILKDKAKHFTDTLYGQLIFMPVYLLLLYAAIDILNHSTVFNNPGGVAFSGSTTGFSFVPVNLIVLGINDFFILFLLNMPLVVAFSYGGIATDWLAGATKKFNAANVWKQTGSFAGRNSVGRAAATFRDSSIGRSIERTSPLAGKLMNKGLTNVASSGFGGGKGAGFDQVTKSKVEDYRKLAEHSQHTDEEAAKIAREKGIIDNDPERSHLKLIATTTERELTPQLQAKQSEYSKLGGMLASETDVDMRHLIMQDMVKVQAEITTLSDKITNSKKSVSDREKEIVKGVKESPKEKMAQEFEGRRSTFGKKVAAAIRKEKKPGDDIMDALNALKNAGTSTPKP